MSDNLEPRPPALQWRVVLPVKGAPDAKSRLDVGPEVARNELALAMALDTLTAALASPAVQAVLVVTSDPAMATAASAAGAQVEPDPGHGLDQAVRRGRDLLATARSGPVAALLADVPALRAEDLTAALASCAAYDAAYVPDAEGTGTVLLAAMVPDGLRPAFGDGSAARHDLVAKRLELDLPRLRRDVDVEASLREARALGVGPRTAALLDGLG
ncbi:MAG: 2-phospho-L-lactate guanylyltransferase [Actinomycetales bacterium]